MTFASFSSFFRVAFLFFYLLLQSATLVASQAPATFHANEELQEQAKGSSLSDSSENSSLVTVGQYCAFLNAVATSDEHHLYDEKMASDLVGASLIRSGSSSSYSYSIDGNEKNPMTEVSFFSAMRYCNWLENKQLSGAQHDETTEAGVYQLEGGQVVSINPKATHFVTSSNSDQFEVIDFLFQSNQIGFYVSDSSSNPGGLSTSHATQAWTIVPTWEKILGGALLLGSVAIWYNNPCGRSEEPLHEYPLQESLPQEHPLNELAIKRVVDITDSTTVQYLESHDININWDSVLGEGGYSTVYRAGASNGKGYAFKFEKGVCKLSALGFDDNAPWSHCRELAVASLYDIPNLIKPLVFFFQQGNKTYSVPVTNVKEFEGVMRRTSNTEPQLLAQLMELAPGENIEKILQKLGPNFFSPNAGVDHFANIMGGLCSTLLKMHDYNLIHGDLKPANIVADYDGSQNVIRSLKLVDLGSAERLYDETDSNTSSYRKSRTMQCGSAPYRAPSIFAEKLYGPEVDFFSLAMTGLRLISLDDFGVFYKQRFKIEERDLFANVQPNEYLETYLSYLNQETRTKRVFRNFPSSKKFIGLLFEASAEGDAGRDALEQLRSKLKPAEESESL